jgi:hypothetical protein
MGEQTTSKEWTLQQYSTNKNRSKMNPMVVFEMTRNNALIGKRFWFNTIHLTFLFF